MKKKTVTIAIILLALEIFLIHRCNAQFLTFPEDDINTQFGFFVDPTLNDKGAQFGVTATMVMNWGFVGVTASTYPELGGVGYTDVVAELGLNGHFGGFEPIRSYAGFRLGRVWRGSGGGFELAGAVIGFDWRLTRRDAPVDFYAGVKLFADYREDQKDGRYGDSGAYKRGLLTNNSMVQENGAIVFSFSF